MKTVAVARLSLVAGLLAMVALSLPWASASAQTESWTEVVRGQPETGLVALTFDAGAGSGRIDLMLAELRHWDVRLTFFLTGQWLATYPQWAQQIVDDGHQLANHSYSHPDFRRLSDAQIRAELRRTEALAQELGVSTLPYFRPPFGARDDRVLRVAREEGYRSVMWTLDSADWRPGATRSEVRERVIRLAQPGDVVVMHVGSVATAEALSEILDRFSERNWGVGTVTEVLGS